MVPPQLCRHSSSLRHATAYKARKKRGSRQTQAKAPDASSAALRDATNGAVALDRPAGEAAKPGAAHSSTMVDPHTRQNAGALASFADRIGAPRSDESRCERSQNVLASRHAPCGVAPDIGALGGFFSPSAGQRHTTHPGLSSIHLSGHASGRVARNSAQGAPPTVSKRSFPCAVVPHPPLTRPTATGVAVHTFKTPPSILRKRKRHSASRRLARRLVGSASSASPDE